MAFNMLLKEFIVENKFNTKQQVIDYFVKRGKTASQGSSAWERGWRGPTKKTPKLTTSQPRTDWMFQRERYMEEMINPVGSHLSPSKTYKSLSKPRKVEPVEPGVKVDIQREKPRDPEEFVYKKPKQNKDRGLAETKSRLSKEASAAIPGASSSGVPDMAAGPSNYYHKYRVGIAMASSPDTGGVNPIGPTSDDMVTIGYTPADRDIADRAYKAMGYKKKKLTSDHSKEVDAHTVSPVSKPKKNRYGI